MLVEMLITRSFYDSGMESATRLLDGTKKRAGVLGRSVRGGLLLDRLLPPRRREAPRRRPYSVWLAQPFAKVRHETYPRIMSSSNTH